MAHHSNALRPQIWVKLHETENLRMRDALKYLSLSIKADVSNSDRRWENLKGREGEDISQWKQARLEEI